MNAVTVLAPAKVNLALEVCGRRADGYHQLDMLMQAVTLYETVRLRRAAAGVLRLACRTPQGAPVPGVPCDMRNLALRAAALFFEATGVEGGVDIALCKRVPAQAGMAGGSADAAGVLFGLDKLYGTHMGLPALCRLGAQLGSDVPFCLVGGTARVRGRGEQVAPADPLPPCRLVAVMPRAGSSTPQGFARYDAMGSPLHPDVEAAAAALRRGDLSALCAAAGNALQAACAGPDTPALLQALRAAGAGAALLTGTGAVCYGIFADDAAAHRAAAALAGAWPAVFLLRPARTGPFILRRRA